MPPAAPPPAGQNAKVDKKPRGTSGTPINFNTNVHPLTVKPKVPFFKHDIRIKVTVQAGDKKFERELTNTCRFFDENTRKYANVAILHQLANKPQLQKKTLIYDRAAILFSPDELIKKGGEEELVFILPKASLGFLGPAFNDALEIAVTIKKATDKYQIASDDYVSAAGADFDESDKSIYELLNIATSQCVVDHGDSCNADSRSRIFILKPAEFHLEEERDIGDGTVLRTSIKKSVKTIENTLKDGKVVNPIPALIMDVSRTAMHKEELLSMKMRYRLPEKQLLGLKVKKTYGNHENLTVCGFSRAPMDQITVKLDEHTPRPRTVNMVQFFKERYNLTIKETKSLGMLDKKGNIYPPELLMVISQPVTPEQYTTNTSRQVITANATLPEERMRSIAALTGALHLEGDKGKQMGIQLPKGQAAIKVAGRMLPSKKLQFGNKKTTMGFPNQRDGTNHVFMAGNMQKWAFLVVSNRDYSFVPPTLQKKGKDLGISVAAPMMTMTNLNPQTVGEALKRAAAAGCTYAFIVSDMEGDHEIIKSAERAYGIATQQMRGRTAEKLAADSGTNIGLKMNIKTGGLNHIVADEPQLLAPDVLIMSLVFDHPQALTKKEMNEGKNPTCPAVIGLGSNSAVLVQNGKPMLAESCQNFTEKFAYANPREWTGEGKFTDTVFQLIRHEIEAFKNARGKPPRQIVVYVSGVPEAERGYWKKDGRALVSDVCHSFSQAYNPATTVITMSTEGCERFFPEGKPPNQRGPDPRIGLVIDSVVVNPKVNEFFLQSAKALKGTPRTIKYTVVAEPEAATAQRSMDDLERLTWALAHLHQYCFSPIGFPVPSRIAADAAKRARDLLKTNHRGGAMDVNLLNTTLGFKCTTVSAARSV